MPRPCKCRRIGCHPAHTFFKPRGVPAAQLEIVALGLDQLEALRLADVESLYHEEAAERMKVSRQTFDRLLQRAHTVVADAIVSGKAILIEGGNVMADQRTFECSGCRHRWSLPFGSGRPESCPACQGRDIHRAPEERGPGRESAGRGRGGRGRCLRRGAGAHS